MFRRRRRRSSFSRHAAASPQQRYLLMGAGAVVVIGLFVFFMHQADKLAPAPHEIRVELPNAFKE